MKTFFLAFVTLIYVASAQQTTLHDFDNFGGVSLPSNWKNAKKEKFWCNDANFGLLRNPAEVKFVSQKYQEKTNVCSITVNKNQFGYKNCDCSGPRKYKFKDEEICKFFRELKLADDAQKTLALKKSYACKGHSSGSLMNFLSVSLMIFCTLLKL